MYNKKTFLWLKLEIVHDKLVHYKSIYSNFVCIQNFLYSRNVSNLKLTDVN